MKKFYTLLSAVALVASAASAAETHPTDGWKSIGTGEYREELFAAMYGQGAGATWQVEIEQSGDWYRFAPYAKEGNVVVDDMFWGETDDTYMYVNAADPNKVYAEPFFPYPDYYMNFWNCVEENGYTDALPSSTGYATLEDGVVEWPANPRRGGTNPWVIVFGEDPSMEGFENLTQTQGVSFTLPGTRFPDYSLSVSTDLFSAEKTINVLLEPGFSLDEIHFYVKYGVHKMNTAEAIKEGPTVSNAPLVNLPLTLDEGNGIYTLMLVGLDKNDNVMSSAINYIVVRDNSEADWQSCGEILFEDPFYNGGIYGSESNRQEYVVELQRDANNPGQFRLIAPFLNDPVMIARMEADPSYRSELNADFNLYFDASDPEKVVLEPGITGIVYDGDIIYAGTPWLTLEGQTFADEAAYEEQVEALVANEKYGTMDEDGLITFPNNKGLCIQYTETEYMYGTWYDEYSALYIQLPEDVLGVKGIVAEDADAPVVYYNLQGVRVDNPAKGGIYIRTQGGKASKVAL